MPGGVSAAGGGPVTRTEQGTVTGEQNLDPSHPGKAPVGGGEGRGQRFRNVTSGVVSRRDHGDKLDQKSAWTRGARETVARSGGGGDVDGERGSRSRESRRVGSTATSRTATDPVPSRPPRRHVRERQMKL